MSNCTLLSFRFRRIRNNEFYDVKIKTFETETKFICVMKEINIAVANIFLDNKY